MGDHKEVLHERFYVKVPGADKLRKTASGRVKFLLATGWRELDRVQRPEHPDHIVVRFERTGHTPLKTRLPKGPQEQPRLERRPRDRGHFGAGRRR